MALRWQLPTTPPVSGSTVLNDVNDIANTLAKFSAGGTAPTVGTTLFADMKGLIWHDTTNNVINIRDQADGTWMPWVYLDEVNKRVIPIGTYAGIIKGQARNLKIDTRSASAVVTADEIALSTAANLYTVNRSVSVTINPAASGANGLDTSTIAASTWYAVYVIYDPTTNTTAGLISLNGTSPTLPSGYTFYARVGWVRTNGSSVLYQTLQIGNDAQWIVDGTILTGMPQIAAGSVGSVTTPTYVSTAWGAYAPTSAKLIRFILSATSATNGEGMIAPNANYGLGSSTSNPPPGKLWSTTNPGGTIEIPLVPESSNVYLATAAAARIYVLGWADGG